MSVKVRVEKDGALWFEAAIALPEGDDSLPILDLIEDEAKRAGQKMPYGCRGGNCATCQVVVTSGAELLEEPGPVEADTMRNFELSEVTRLSCRARFREGATGLLKLEIPTW